MTERAQPMPVAATAKHPPPVPEAKSGSRCREPAAASPQRTLRRPRWRSFGQLSGAATVRDGLPEYSGGAANRAGATGTSGATGNARAFTHPAAPMGLATARARSGSRSITSQKTALRQAALADPCLRR